MHSNLHQSNKGTFLLCIKQLCKGWTVVAARSQCDSREVVAILSDAIWSIVMHFVQSMRVVGESAPPEVTEQPFVMH